MAKDNKTKWTNLKECYSKQSEADLIASAYNSALAKIEAEGFPTDRDSLKAMAESLSKYVGDAERAYLKTLGVVPTEERLRISETYGRAKMAISDSVRAVARAFSNPNVVFNGDGIDIEETYKKIEQSCAYDIDAARLEPYIKAVDGARAALKALVEMDESLGISTMQSAENIQGVPCVVDYAKVALGFLDNINGPEDALELWPRAFVKQQ